MAEPREACTTSGTDHSEDQLYRNAGLASHALMELREYCVSQGVRAISVEVGPDNAPARALYRRAGFVETDHLLLTMELGRPAVTANA